MPLAFTLLKDQECYKILLLSAHIKQNRNVEYYRTLVFCMTIFSINNNFSK